MAHRSLKKYLLLGLLVLATGYLLVELVIYLADYITGDLPTVVRYPGSLLFCLLLYTAFRLSQLLITALDWPLSMFILTWLNMNLTIVLFARFVWHFSLSLQALPILLRRLVMLAIEGLIPYLTWLYLVELRVHKLRKKRHQQQHQEMVVQSEEEEDSI